MQVQLVNQDNGIACHLCRNANEKQQQAVFAARELIDAMLAALSGNYGLRGVLLNALQVFCGSLEYTLVDDLSSMLGALRDADILLRLILPDLMVSN